MRAKGDKGLHLLARAFRFPCFLKDEFDGRSQVVVTDAVRDASKVLKGTDVPPEEAFLPLGGKGHRERAAGVA